MAQRADSAYSSARMMSAYGVRLGEALAIRHEDLDLPGRRLSVTGSLRPIPRDFRSDQRRGTRLQRVEPKSASGFRTIALPAFVAEALARQIARTSSRPRSLVGYIFTTLKGTPLDPRNVSREFEHLLRSNGLPKMRIHDLRHAAASLMLFRGYTLEDVKRVLGHGTITQTSNTYGHLVEGRSREIADGMDALFGA